MVRINWTIKWFYNNITMKLNQRYKDKGNSHLAMRQHIYDTLDRILFNDTKYNGFKIIMI